MTVKPLTMDLAPWLFAGCKRSGDTIACKAMVSQENLIERSDVAAACRGATIPARLFVAKNQLFVVFVLSLRVLPSIAVRVRMFMATNKNCDSGPCVEQ
jgi:hypothetical protein